MPSASQMSWAMYTQAILFLIFMGIYGYLMVSLIYSFFKKLLKK
jgi:hypothetical protein